MLMAEIRQEMNWKTSWTRKKSFTWAALCIFVENSLPAREARNAQKQVSTADFVGTQFPWACVCTSVQFTGTTKTKYNRVSFERTSL